MPQYTDAQIKSYAMQLQSKGASPEEIEQFVASAKGVSVKTPNPTDTQTQQGSGIGSAIVGAAKGAASQVGDDFKSLGSLFTHSAGAVEGAAQGKGLQYQGGENQFWSDIGGSVNALSDVALVAGTVAGDVATGGTDTPAVPGEIGTEIAARDAAETGIKGAVSKFAKSKVGSATGRFAAGKGVGLAAQVGASGASAFSQAKAKGQGTGSALASGAISAGLTWATFDIMNYVAPAAYNKFLGVVSGLKVAPYVKSMLDKTTTLLQKAATEAQTTKTMGYLKTTVNAAATSLGKATGTIFKAMSDNLGTPTNEQVASLANEMRSNVSKFGNPMVDQIFSNAKKALAPFAVSVAKLGSIVGDATKKGAETSEDDIKAELARMAKSGEIKNNGSDAATAASNLAKGKAGTALAQDADESVADRVKTFLSTAGSKANVSISDLLSVMNVIPNGVQEAKSTSALWDAIRTAVGDDPAGKQALEDWIKGRSTRAAQGIQSDMSDTLERAAANPDALLSTSQKAAQKTPQSTWQNFVSGVWDNLRNQTDVTHLRAMFRTPQDFKQFGTMLTKKILFDSMNAYRVALGDASRATPATLAAASKAFTDKAGSYLDRLVSLDGLLDNESMDFLKDMTHAVPDLETIAKNTGTDVSGLVDEGGKPLMQVEQEGKEGAKMSEEELSNFQKSPVGAFLSKAGADFREFPAALMKTAPSVLASLKKSMPEEDWKAVGASVLGHIVQTIKGLWGETDPKTIESTLEKISAGVSGDKEVFETLFNTGEGKSSGEGEALLHTLSNYGAALKQQGSKTFTKVFGNAAASATFAVIHHEYMAAVLANKAIRALMGDEEKSVIDQVANMSKGDLNKEFKKAATDSTTGFPKLILQFSNILTRVLGSYTKYEIGNRLMQNAGGVAGDVTSDITGDSTSENQ